MKNMYLAAMIRVPGRVYWPSPGKGHLYWPWMAPSQDRNLLLQDIQLLVRVKYTIRGMLNATRMEELCMLLLSAFTTIDLWMASQVNYFYAGGRMRSLFECASARGSNRPIRSVCWLGSRYPRLVERNLLSCLVLVGREGSSSVSFVSGSRKRVPIPGIAFRITGLAFREVAG
jgi:hypothetical protein